MKANPRRLPEQGLHKEASKVSVVAALPLFHNTKPSQDAYFWPFILEFQN